MSAKNKSKRKTTNCDESGRISTECPLELLDDTTFPNLFSHLPRFWTVGVENRSKNREPLAISPYMERFDDLWILFMTFPGVCNSLPHGRESLKQLLSHAHLLKEVGCHVFLLSTDSWSSQRILRDAIESKEECNDNVTFLSDDPKTFMVGKKLQVYCEDSKQKFLYPAYFLLTPDRELVQYCVIRDANKLCEKNEHTTFSYPFNMEVFERMVDSINELKPIHDWVKSVRLSSPRITFGNFLLNMVYRIEKMDMLEEEDGKKQPLSAWKGWAEAVKGVFSGGLN